MTRAAENSFGAMSFEDRTADSLRQNDWGGIWNPIASKFDWTFWLLYLTAEKRAPMPVTPVRGATNPAVYRGQLVAERFETAEIDDKVTKFVGNGNKEPDDSWVDRIAQYSAGFEARVAIMGWPWFDRHPDYRMPHDGALRVLTAQRWADWLSMMGLIRGFNSALGEGLVPDMDDYLKNESVKVRNYSNETVWLESDEGALRDPQAVWGNMRGIIRDHVVNIINYRLHGNFGNRHDRDDSLTPNYLDVRIDSDDARRDKATRVRDRVGAMWVNAPLDGIKRRLYKIFDDAVAERGQFVVHVRPLYMKLVNGLPKNVVDQLQPIIRGLNRRSDKRVRIWAAHMATGLGNQGRRGFSLGDWARLVQEGYGTNLRADQTSEEEQAEQEQLGFMAWMNGQYDRAIFLARGMVMSKRLLPDVFELKKEIVHAVSGGLSPMVAWTVVDIISKEEKGIFLNLKDTLPSLEQFSRDHALHEMNEKFSDMLVKTNGLEEFEAVVMGHMFEEMRNPRRGARVS
jgi:hypothetical protein